MLHVLLAIICSQCPFYIYISLVACTIHLVALREQWTRISSKDSYLVVYVPFRQQNCTHTYICRCLLFLYIVLLMMWLPRSSPFEYDRLTRQFRFNTRVFFEFINHVLLNYRRKYFVDDIVKKKTYLALLKQEKWLLVSK